MSLLHSILLHFFQDSFAFLLRFFYVSSSSDVHSSCVYIILPSACLLVTFIYFLFVRFYFTFYINDNFFLSRISRISNFNSLFPHFFSSLFFATYKFLNCYFFLTFIFNSPFFSVRPIRSD